MLPDAGSGAAYCAVGWLNHAIISGMAKQSTPRGHYKPPEEHTVNVSLTLSPLAATFSEWLAKQWPGHSRSRIVSAVLEHYAWEVFPQAYPAEAEEARKILEGVPRRSRE